jgi:CBS domain-containing protein/sporulation protein YlmC with PRC-barrel domain
MTYKNGKEESFFLTQLLGARASLQSRKIGKLKDLVAVDQGKVAEVTHFQIARPFGEPALLIPSQKVRSVSPREIVLDIEDPKAYVRDLSPEEVLLRDYLLDKKVLDIDDRDVEVVYDVRLVLTNNRIYVVDVDISRYGLLVRLGLKGLAAFLSRRAGAAQKKLIPWSYVQPLSPQLGTLQGDLKLNILKEKLSEIHPVDLADILEEMDSSQRAILLDGLDTEHASDTLEEIDPAVQRDIVFSLSKERVAQLIGEMTPGQAADIISVLPAEERRSILKLLEPAQVAKIDEIIEKQDTTILNFATVNFLKCAPETTVEQARNKLRDAAESMDVVMYFYIVDESDKLLGVIDIKEVFVARDTERLKELMTENVISLNKDSTMKHAADMFLRYGFRALPITDENDIILGVVPYRDVMNLKHRILE